MTRCRVSAFAGRVKAQAGHSWVQLSRARERRDAPGGGGDGASAREAVAVRASRKRKSPRLMGSVPSGLVRVNFTRCRRSTFDRDPAPHAWLRNPTVACAVWLTGPQTGHGPPLHTMHGGSTSPGSRPRCCACRALPPRGCSRRSPAPASQADRAAACPLAHSSCQPTTMHDRDEWASRWAGWRALVHGDASLGVYAKASCVT